MCRGPRWKDALELVARGRRVAWPNGVDPAPMAARRLRRLPYDAKSSPRAFERLNGLVARAPFHIHIAKTYTLEATAQALRDVQKHHLGKLAIRIH